MDDMRRAMPSVEDVRNMIPGVDDFKAPGRNDFLRPEVLGGAALVAAAFFMPPVWRVGAGVLGGMLIGYGLFVEHGSRYPSEHRGDEYYSTYGNRSVGSRSQDDDLVDSMSMDSFPTSDPPATY
jgi:hypothetical protein